MNLVNHPTTWLFVDDETRFLESIKAFLPRDQLAIFFDDPREALSYLKSKNKHRHEGDIQSDFDLDDARDAVTIPERFKLISVVVADFAMPQMTGLELFAQLHADTVGKILLTGVADEEIAVAAFNQGVIDRFIRKGNTAALDEIQVFAHQLQEKWFKSFQKTMFPSVLRNPLDDAQVLEAMQRVLSEYEIVEWYFSGMPSGFYCLDKYGNDIFVSVIDQKSLERNHAQATAYGCTPGHLEAQTDSPLVTMLFDPILENESYDWVFNSTRVERVGSSYWLGVHSAPPSDINFLSDRHSFHWHLPGY